jgi:hypothetical protein
MLAVVPLGLVSSGIGEKQQSKRGHHSADDDGLLLPILLRLSLYPMFDGLLSVTNEHVMTVEKSHACHNALAAFSGYLLGTLEHLLKLIVEFIYASVCEL